MRVEILTEDQAVKALPYPIEVKSYEGGTQLVPSSAFITVKDPEGTAQVEDQAMAIDANGTMTYTLPAEKTSKLWENAIIEISYVLSPITYKAVFHFDVVLCQIKPTVVDADLKNYFPQLAEEIWASETNYDKQIQEAFKIIKRDIKDKGRRPAMLIDGMQVRELLITKSFELIFFEFAKSEEDIWWKRYEEMKDRYRERFDKLTIKYDRDEDMLIDEDEKVGSLGQITLER
jgi:hypothetical protein